MTVTLCARDIKEKRQGSDHLDLKTRGYNENTI